MNLTVSIDDETLQRARVRALVEHTSVNALVRDFLQDYADRETLVRSATDRFLELARASQAGSGPQGRTWSREDIYDRAVFWR